jgi:hypothetical protein
MTANNIQFHFNSLVEISDKKTGEVFVRKSNAIHPENMARMIAYGLATENEGSIYMVALGNGGTYNDTAGIIHYNAPITTDVNATLYNQTYPTPATMSTDTSTVVLGSGATNGSLTPISTSGNTISIVNVSLTIPSTLPSGQGVSDAAIVTQNNYYDPTNSTSPTADYTYNFDELGLIGKNPLFGQAGQPEWLLLTHIVFNPIAKTQNRELQLSYSLSISAS